MYFQQAELFGGLDEGFMKKFMDLGKKETHQTGHILIREGDRAGFFFVLLEGSVKITIGETGHTLFTVDQPFESFGWSSLVGRDKYSASAECREKTTLLRIDVQKFTAALEDDAKAGITFYKGLARGLGNRLVQSYRLMSDATQADVLRSYGTGQVIESEMNVS